MHEREKIWGIQQMQSFEKERNSKLWSFGFFFQNYDKKKNLIGARLRNKLKLTSEEQQQNDMYSISYISTTAPPGVRRGSSSLVVLMKSAWFNGSSASVSTSIKAEDLELCWATQINVNTEPRRKDISSVLREATIVSRQCGKGYEASFKTGP